MMVVPDLLVFRRAKAPLRVSGRYSRTSAYRQYQTARDSATTYSEAVAFLEQLARNPAAEARAGAVGDFAPATPFARRFLNTTSLALTRPSGDPMRLLAERAWRALAGLSVGPVGQSGRPRHEPVSAETVRRIVTARRTWEQTIRPIWKCAVDRADVLVRIIRACRGRIPSAVAYARALETLVGRPALRPVDLANQLAAWQEGVSVRCVRTVMRAAASPRSADRVFA